MTDRIEKLLNILQNEKYKVNRSEMGYDLTSELDGKSELQKSALRFVRNIEAEETYFHQGERIGFNRINSKLFSF